MESEETNKAKLERTALILFAARGYDAVGVQELAETAGVTKPTLYHYFHSKKGLFVALLSGREQPLLSRLSKAAEYRRDVKFNLDSLALEYYRYFRENREFFRLVLAQYFSPPDCEIHETVQSFNRKVFSLFEALFRAAEKDHGNMRGRSTAYAATFIGMLHTYIGLSLSGHGDLADDALRRAVHQFMHGIFS